MNALREIVEVTGIHYVSISKELLEILSEDWSRPVQVKFENGELIFRYVEGYSAVIETKSE
jgi:hypothetical protein